MHGPTCSFWADLTSFSLAAAVDPALDVETGLPTARGEPASIDVQLVCAGTPGPGQEQSTLPGHVIRLVLKDDDGAMYSSDVSHAAELDDGAVVDNGEKQIGGSGGSLDPTGPLLEPPGPLLTLLLLLRLLLFLVT